MDDSQVARYQRDILQIDKAENIFDPLHSVNGDQDNVDSRDNESLPVSLASLFSSSTPFSVQRLLNPQTHYKRHLIMFNSVQQNATMNGSGVMQFDMTFTGATGDIEQGNCLARWPDNCAHIVGIRYAGGLRMIRAENTISQAVPQLWYTESRQTLQQTTICLEEFADQAFIGPPYPAQTALGTRATRNRRFHFIGEQSVAYEPGFNMFQIPINIDSGQFGQGFYWFARPYIPPQTITMSFGAPFVPIDLPGTILTGPATKTMGDTLLVTSAGFTMVINTPCYIRGFTTTDPVGDAALIERVNTVLHTDITLVAELPAVRQLEFNDVDLTGVTLPAGLVVQCISTQTPMYIVPIEFYYTEY